MMVIFLTGIVSLILMRTLRKDYAKYARETGDLDDLDQRRNGDGGHALPVPRVNVRAVREYKRLAASLAATAAAASWTR